MRILFVKRAYNSRLHAQVEALRARGHAIELLLEASVEEGYHCAGQWDAHAVAARFPLHRSLPQPGSPREAGAGSSVFAERLLGLPGARRLAAAGPVRRRLFARALRRVLASTRFDLVVSANDAVRGEDARTLAVLEQCSGRIPVVYDCQDFLSDCFADDPVAAAQEREANERADGVIHTNPAGLHWISERCRIGRGLAFPNYPSAADFRAPLPKLSAQDGRIHLVYCGGVQRTPPGQHARWARDMKDVFREIASLGFPLHLHLGVRPGSPVWRHYEPLASVPGIHLHPFLPYAQMMRTLTRYDVGLFPLELGDRRDDAARRGVAALAGSPFSRIDTSKQYEYVLAGLPVLTAPVEWVSTWLRENRFGDAFHSVPHLGELLREGPITEWQRAVRERAARFSVEAQIDVLEDFLLDVAGCRR